MPVFRANRRVPPSCLPHSLPTLQHRPSLSLFFSPPHSSNAISKALPTNLATRQRTAPLTEAALLNHLQLWQTQRGKSFLLSDETGSCSFFFPPRQSAPSVSSAQLAPDVHHTMVRRLHLWGSRGETAGRQAASTLGKQSCTPSQQHPRAERNQCHPPSLIYRL